MRTVKRYADGSQAKVFDDGSWHIRLPDNSKPSGKETDADAALVAVEATHTAFVMKCWESTGRHTPHGFLVSVRAGKEST